MRRNMRRIAKEMTKQIKYVTSASTKGTRKRGKKKLVEEDEEVAGGQPSALPLPSTDLSTNASADAAPGIVTHHNH